MKVTPTMKSLSEGELLKRIRLMRDMEPLYEGDLREDNAQAEAWLRERLRTEYRNLLTTMQTECLPLKDITSEVTVAKKAEGVREVSLPRGILRLAEVKMKGDVEPAKLIAADSPEAEAQKSPLSRGGRHSPIGIMRAGGIVRIFGGKESESDEAERVMAVMCPEEGIYELTPEMENELIKNCIGNEENR